MSVRDEIVSLLEKGYVDAVSKYGIAGFAVLKELIESDSPLLATKAVHAASYFDLALAEPLLKETARSRERVLRVAAAIGASRLGEDGRAILNYLNRSKDPSIKKWAARGLRKLEKLVG